MKLTREEKIKLSIEMYEEGCTMREIANEIGMSDKWIRENMPGFDERRAKRIEKIKQRRKSVIDMWNTGMKKKDIADKLEISVRYVTDTIARESARKEYQEAELLRMLNRAPDAPKLPQVKYKEKRFNALVNEVTCMKCRDCKYMYNNETMRDLYICEFVYVIVYRLSRDLVVCFLIPDDIRIISQDKGVKDV